MTIFLKAAMLPISPASLLPVDLAQATLIGRIWRDGPCVVAVRGGEVIDIAETVATVAELFESDDALGIARHAPGTALGPVQALMAQALKAPADRPLLLAPCDLQAIKACGVTFAVSLLERVIEEQAGGDAARAASLRSALQDTLGSDLSALRPGSEAAQRLKQQLQQRGAWSQYMEVGIGPDAEVFTKAQAMSSVGCGAQVGCCRRPPGTTRSPRSSWPSTAEARCWGFAGQRRQPARHRRA
jgi:fumarylacetoacetate (FAA) hydrolase family protein